jgi:regulatory protein
VIDDARFAGTLAGGLRRRGASKLAIVQKLRARGVSDDVARAALEQVDRDEDAEPEPELAAARALIRRRRIGPFRPEAERLIHARRDLGALARAGFSFEVARRALDIRDDDDA